MSFPASSTPNTRLATTCIARTTASIPLRITVTHCRIPFMRPAIHHTGRPHPPPYSHHHSYGIALATIHTLFMTKYPIPALWVRCPRSVRIHAWCTFAMGTTCMTPLFHTHPVHPYTRSLSYAYTIPALWVPSVPCVLMHATTPVHFHALCAYPPYTPSFGLRAPRLIIIIRARSATSNL